MEEYKKAKDLRLGDVFFRSCAGEIKELKVESLSQYEGFITVNNNIHFKVGGSKGMQKSITHRYEIGTYFNTCDLDAEHYLFSTDIRCSKTHCKNYALRRIAGHKAEIDKNLESILHYNDLIAKLY